MIYKEILNILIIEDNPGDLRLIQRHLSGLPTSTKYRLHNSSSLNKGFDIIKNTDIDCVLLDLNLDKYSGVDTMRFFHSSFPDLPAIVLTGFNDESLGLSCLEEGASYYLAKDEITREILVRSIWYAISWKKAILKENELGEKLKLERDKLLTLINSITDEIWFCDKNGKMILYNKAAVRGLGLEGREDLLSNLTNLINNLEVYTIDDIPRDKEEAPLLRSLKGEIVECCEEKVRNLLTGSTKFRQVNSAPILSESGEIMGAVAVVRDITKQKETEAGFRDYKLKYEQLICEHEKRAATTSSLSLQELKVLKLTAKGYSPKDISSRLDIKVKTVYTYRMRIMKKLSITNIPDLVKYSIEMDLTGN